MKKTCIFLLCITMFAGMTAVLYGEPAVSETEEFYAVTGNTANDLRKSLNTLSPVTYNGKKYDAYTSWYVKWQFYWDSPDPDYSISRVTTTVDAKYTLPEWTGSEDADEDLKEKWNKYFKALLQHEKGHTEFGIRAAREIEAALRKIPPRPSSAQLEKEANSLGYRILNKYLQLEKQYDIDTRHGARDGALFP